MHKPLEFTLKNCTQEKLTQLPWLLQSTLIMLLALTSKGGFAATDVIADSSTSISCPNSAYAVNKEWFKTALGKAVHDKEIALSEQGIEELAYFYFDESKGIKVVPFIEPAESDAFDVRIKKIALDLDPEVARTLLNGVSREALKGEDDGLGRPFQQLEDVRHAYFVFFMDMGNAMLKKMVLR